MWQCSHNTNCSAQHNQSFLLDTNILTVRKAKKMSILWVPKHLMSLKYIHLDKTSPANVEFLSSGGILSFEVSVRHRILPSLAFFLKSRTSTVPPRSPEKKKHATQNLFTPLDLRLQSVDVLSLTDKARLIGSVEIMRESVEDVGALHFVRLVKYTFDHPLHLVVAQLIACVPWSKTKQSFYPTFKEMGETEWTLCEANDPWNASGKRPEPHFEVSGR